MQEALLPELDRRCGNSRCEKPVATTRHQYCSITCQRKAFDAREDQRCSQLVSKTCRECQQEQPIAEFRPPRSLRCRACMKVRRQEEYKRRGGKEWIYSHNLKQYGLTLDEYQAMLAKQGGSCAICGDEPSEGKRLNVDHNHETGAVRDLLCRWCNYALGNAKDDPARLRAMADYLDRHRAAENRPSA